jgi:G:T/U-mismatch repair DNA glycosylase
MTPKPESHPFKPFLPAEARLLMLGTFPPSPKRWAMAFYYPNIQNDMWRIVGLCFFGDKQHFITPDRRHYKEEELKAFLNQQGIALYDTCTRIIRSRNTASDKDLQVVEQTDVKALLRLLPKCKAIITAGQLATTLCCLQLGVAEAKIGEHSTAEIDGRKVDIYRMPSSSRAYPMTVEKKAQMYQQVFDIVAKQG